MMKLDNLLGLKRHTVQLVPHDNSWKDSFQKTKKELSILIGQLVLDIQHIGSTSIKHTVAKPILDIAIAVKDINIIGEIIPILENNNYEYRGDSGNEGGHLFVKCSAPGVRTHHIHVVEIDDPQWANYIKFRNKLRENKSLAIEYSELKIELGQKYFNNRRAYTNSKNTFIARVLNEIKKASDKS